MNRLEPIIDLFQSVDAQMRLELLLDYSRKLPPLEERFHEARDAGLGSVPECQTPVFLWIEAQDGKLRLHVDVAEEAPTVKGLLAILVEAYDNAPADEVMAMPDDLLNRLGLDQLLRMNRAVGFSAMVGRVKREAAKAADGSAATTGAN